MKDLTTKEIEIILARIKAEISTGVYQPPAELLRIAYRDPEVVQFIHDMEHSAYYQFLALFTRYTRPRNVFELGTQHGTGSIMMYSELAPDARLTTIELASQQFYMPEEMRDDTRFRLIIGDCLDLSAYPTVPGDIDLLFTDTIHNYRQIKDEYDVYRHFLTDGAFVLIDDINLTDKRRLVDELPLEKWDLTDWCHFNGFGLIRYRQIGDESPLLAALTASRVGFRKYHGAQAELDDQFLRKVYWKVVRALDVKHPFFTFGRRSLRSLKLLYTPNERTY
jgi:predicted O-methyltransferase YrrM